MRSSPPPWHMPVPRGFPRNFEKPLAVEGADDLRIDVLGGCNSRTQQLAAHLSSPDFHENETITMASSRCMRVARIRIIDQGARLLEAKMGLEGLFLVTIIPPHWFVPESQLPGGPLPDFKKQLRGYLHRAGIHDTNGLIIGHFEAAYCRQSSTGRLGFAFHVHLVCEANAREVFERMRGITTLTPTRDVPQPMRIEPIRDAELRSVLGYCFMSFWRCRTIDSHPEGLDDVRRPHGSRLPDKALCRELLWRQHRRLADTSIVVGTRGMARAFRHTWS